MLGSVPYCSPGLAWFAYTNSLCGQDRRSSSANVHRWEFFVSMDCREDEERFIDHVTVQLHPTFSPPTVTLWEPPFRVRRVGWGVFYIRAVVHFRSQWQRPPLRIAWLLDFSGHGAMQDIDVTFTPPPVVDLTRSEDMDADMGAVVDLTHSGTLSSELSTPRFGVHAPAAVMSSDTSAAVMELSSNSDQGANRGAAAAPTVSGRSAPGMTSTNNSSRRGQLVQGTQEAGLVTRRFVTSSTPLVESTASHSNAGTAGHTSSAPWADHRGVMIDQNGNVTATWSTGSQDHTLDELWDSSSNDASWHAGSSEPESEDFVSGSESEQDDSNQQHAGEDGGVGGYGSSGSDQHSEGDMQQVDDDVDMEGAEMHQ